MQIHQDPVPLRIDESGQVRVGPTRVIFKLVIEAFLHGASPEEIANNIYTSLKIEDVYGAIAYYFRHKEEVQQYLREWDERAAQVQQEIESQPGYQEWKQSMKERIMQRKAQMEQAHASTPQ